MPCGQRLGIVITGGSRGLGFALAQRFLAHGDRVVICARDSARVQDAVRRLRQDTGQADIHGIGFDVRDDEDTTRFKDFVLSRLGQVDRWINNAGTAGERNAPLWALDQADMLETTTTNLFGALAMSSLAVQIMREQPPSDAPVYHLFNMGFSELGARLSRSPIPHKASKIGVAVVTRSLRAELAAHGLTSIGVHALSPGLVKTDLLRRVTTSDAAGFVAIAAERPDAVARSLVPKIRQVRGRGSSIRHRSLPVMVARILVRLSLRAAGGLVDRRRRKPRE